ncbi:hypothetical protein HHK36_016635 [Tetracentron sinense]|uniref:C2H2-type domain-containing protein n=1 Tax=Tetracentron sinense TaxID=13715 RepID=A0A835DB51_TETSI|nr:hypothetical protein HHK36_016635 [Tetracentron sinense]
MLIENNLLSVLLGKESTFCAVLWDPESLPSPSNDSQPFLLSTSPDTSGILADERNTEVCSIKHTASCMENVVHNEAAIVSTKSREKMSYVAPKNGINHNNLVDQTSLYMETEFDLYMDDDDLPCGLQVDSGTLTCVACGILGFPFMSVVQPSEIASKELFPADSQLVQEGVGVIKSVKPHVPSLLSDTAKDSASEGDQNENWKGKLSSKCNRHIPMSGASKSRRDDKLMKNGSEEFFTDASSLSSEAKSIEVKETNPLRHPIGASSSAELNHSLLHSTDDLPPVPNLPQIPGDLPIPFVSKVDKGWNTSNGYLRPRIFCLEHALEIEELLHSKGGVNVLVICHSGYQKMKAHALAIAEEIDTTFNYKEIPLENASQEDLNLINVSIDNEEHEECGEDWTSKLGLNLRYCVKVRKIYPSKQEQHALALGGLFSDMLPGSDMSGLKWHSRRTRTLHKATGPSQLKPCKNTQVKDDMLVQKSDETAPKENKIIQYSRRSSNGATAAPAGASKARGRPRKHPLKEVATANGGDLDKNIRNTSEDAHCDIDNAGSGSVEFASFPTVRNSEMQHKILTAKVTREISKVSDLALPADSLATAIPLVKSSESQIENPTVKETNMKGKACDLVTVDNSGTKHGIWNAEETSTSEASDAVQSAGVLGTVISTVGKFEAQMETQTVEEPNMKGKHCDLMTVDSSKLQDNIWTAEETTKTTEISDAAEFAGLLATAISTVGRFEVQIENRNVEETNTKDEACNLVTLNSSGGHPKIQTDEETDKMSTATEPAKSTCPHVAPVPSVESIEAQTVNPIVEEIMDEACNCVTLDNEMQPVIQTSDGTKEDADISNYAKSKDQQPTTVSMEESSEVPEGTRATDIRNLNAKVCSLPNNSEFNFNTHRTVVDCKLTARAGNKRKREVEQIMEGQLGYNGFIRSPCEGLRPRTRRVASGGSETDIIREVEEKSATKKVRSPPDGSVICKEKKDKVKGVHRCSLEGCRMSFKTRTELLMHERNRCPHEGCGKRFSNHKYAMLHQRVHIQERPLKCSWKGCEMSFKWAWARTEHLRVHTGERPYQCKVAGCSLTFRFVSDFSRHRRKTGHYVNSPA